MGNITCKIRRWNGYCVFPLNFPYLEACLRGRPQHVCDMTDPFAAKHPPMPRSKRAKQFAPFDALDGFGDNIQSKNVHYVERIVLEEEDIADLNLRLNILQQLTYNRKIARANNVTIAVTYYVPCTDKNIFAYQLKGVYNTYTGTCWKVDSDVNHTIRVGDKDIRFDDIIGIESKNLKFLDHYKRANLEM